ncbi:tetratricopeptide repeat protein [Dongia soli]|uniref:Tetratricopeptide repeat protein n=1 Tax=Dongia soli TaxID=600628 RepID=A0ABU5E6Y1_9PROT|nr:tetratricopeptide repeat protein [Dongia soli]MDY0881616.1 tetratricopeptide repeat protein [Dongia soli]
MPVRLFTVAEIDRNLPLWRHAFPSLAHGLAQSEKLPAALRQTGLALWRKSRLSEALSLLTAAVSLEPDNPLIWGELGGVFQASGRSAEAEDCIRASLDLDHEQPQAWLLLATLSSETQRHDLAEEAFLKALSLAPHLVEASLGLGILYFGQRRFDEAAAQLRVAAVTGDMPSAQALLGQALFLTGDFAGAGAALAEAMRLMPDQPLLRQKLAMARFLEAVADTSVDEAMTVYDGTAGADGEIPAAITEKAFHLLSGFGQHEAAIRVAQFRLANQPNDPMQRYLLAAVKGERMPQAPADYLRAYFDRFAGNFDKQLVEVLGYNVPAALHALIAPANRRFRHILDIGCGTGLSAPLFVPLGDRLTGVDISPGMLERAAERRLYDDLVEADVVAYLAAAPNVFDLILAADLLIYIGDIEALMARVASALESGGLFAFSIETTDEEDYRLLPSGRFAHHPMYIDRVAAGDFVPCHVQPTSIRLEANRPVPGMLFVLQRR